jgi:lycopene beta-cyclase
MVWGKKDGMLIAGGGVAASLAALAMATRRPEVPLMLVSEEESLGGDRTLVLLDGDLGEEEEALVAPLVSQGWDGWYALFPDLTRKMKAGVRMIAPHAIDSAVRAALPPERIVTGARIVAVREDRILLHGGETMVADGAIDGRGDANLSLLELGWRATVSRVYRFPAPHRLDRPVLVDGTVDQGGACRFVSALPLDGERLLVELHTFSGASDAGSAARAVLEAWVAGRGWAGGEIERETRAALPVALGGDLAALWRIGGARVARLGQRGGFFHPTSGSPLADSAAAALLLTRQRDFSGAGLHDTLFELANALWKRRDFYRGFNRALLGDKGCAAIEGLCRLDSEMIARFRGERLGMFDRRKVMASAG